MLFNLGVNVCVSKHGSTDSAKWICYVPCTTNLNKKKVVWEKASGLMNRANVVSWLESRNLSSSAVEKFLEIK